jgi:RND family efflux transporter MFP subunit
LDLSPLRIERKAEAPTPAAAARRTGGVRLMPWLLLLAVVGAAWLLWPRISSAIDRLRLPEVEVATASAPSPLAATAIAGTAANGYLVASKRAALSADTPGRIVEMNVAEGMVVPKGFVVARLYSDEQRAALARAQAEVAAHDAALERAGREVAAAQGDAERAARSRATAVAARDERAAILGQAATRLARAERMVADDVESRQWLDDARSEHARASAALAAAEAQLGEADASIAVAGRRVEVQQAAHAEEQARGAVLAAARDLAQATLEKTEVKAPFDGVVVLKDAEVGEVVSPNAQGGNSRGSVATMVDFASLELQVELPERSIASVRIGAPARIFLDAFPDRGYEGEVTRIWPTANRSKATIEVRVKFRSPDDRLRPEMGARVVFLAGEAPAAVKPAAPDGVFVPPGAIVRIAGRAGVFRLERDVARFVQVTTGEESLERVLVTSGLAAGERVIRTPPVSLEDGDRVRVKGDA